MRPHWINISNRRSRFGRRGGCCAPINRTPRWLTIEQFESALRIFGHAFWGTKDTTADVTLTIPGSTTAPQTLHLASTSGSATHREGTIDSMLPLTGVAPVSYTLHIEARLPGGDDAPRRALCSEVNAESSDDS